MFDCSCKHKWFYNIQILFCNSNIIFVISENIFDYVSPEILSIWSTWSVYISGVERYQCSLISITLSATSKLSFPNIITYFGPWWSFQTNEGSSSNPKSWRGQGKFSVESDFSKKHAGAEELMLWAQWSDGRLRVLDCGTSNRYWWKEIFQFLWKD